MFRGNAEDLEHVVVQERKRFAEIATEFYANGSDALLKLPDYLVPHTELAKLNADFLRDRPRRSGQPYFAHPLSVAHIIHLLTEEPLTAKALPIALTHDLLDEGLDGKPGLFLQVVANIHSKHGAIYDDILAACPILCVPWYREFMDIPECRIAEKVAAVLNVGSFGSQEHAAVFIADKLANAFDLDFLKEFSPGNQEQFVKLRYIALLDFASSELSLLLEAPLFGAARGTSDYLQRKYLVAPGERKRCLSEFRKYSEQHKDELYKQIERFHEQCRA